MDWKDIYKSKLVDADTAVKAINNGDRIVLSGTANSPRVVGDALVRRIKELDSVTIGQVLPYYAPHLQEDVKDHVKIVTPFVGPAQRANVNNGTGQYLPVTLCEYGKALGVKFKPDAAIMMTSAPDAHGYVSLGLFSAYMPATIPNVKTLIAEVNPNMPRVHGNCNYHISEFTYLVESEEPIIEIPRPQIGPVEQAIGEHIASYIKDGDCLQLGIGSIPDAVAGFLKEKNDLGVHSETFSDGTMDLVKLGVITNKKKTLNPGKMVSTFFHGTREFYDFLDDNPTILLTGVEYSNDPYIISQNDNLISINSAIEVDLLGQVASESIGPKQHSATGGQVDFVRGARLSRGGKSFLAFPSTATDKNGNLISKIVTTLAPGTPVSTGRNDVEYVVTEYGVAYLAYKTMRERAEELINIAHPDFRAELRADLNKNLLFKDN